MTMSETCEKCGAFYCEYLLDGLCNLCALKRLKQADELQAENDRLKEFIELFIEREINLHDREDQPYACDWILINQAKQALSEDKDDG